MKFANPIICQGTRVQVIRNGCIYSLTGEPAFIRIEPEFVFEHHEVTFEVLQGSSPLLSDLRQASRDTIALFIPFGNLKPGRYEGRIAVSGKIILQFSIEVCCSTFHIECACAAEQAESQFFRERYALQALPFEQMLSAANLRLKERGATLVVLTGSVGKTTTKELIASSLSSRLNLAKTSDSWNFPHEICSQIANNPWADVFAIEASLNPYVAQMGTHLVPDIFVFIEVGAAHTQLSPSLDDIAMRKLTLAGGMSSGGTIVANIGNPYIRRALQTANLSCPVITVSEREEVPADVQILADKTETRVVAHGRRISCAPLPPYLSPSSVGCALAVHLLLDGASDAAQHFLSNLSEFQPIKGRMELFRIGEVEVLNDAYNANPLSMSNLFKSLQLQKSEGKRILLILGDMGDLGELTQRMHSKVLSEASEVSDRLIVCGKHFTEASGGSHRSLLNANTGELLGLIRSESSAFDLIALKGSNSSGLFEVGRQLASNSELALTQLAAP